MHRATIPWTGEKDPIKSNIWKWDSTCSQDIFCNLHILWWFGNTIEMFPRVHFNRLTVFLKKAKMCLSSRQAEMWKRESQCQFYESQDLLPQAFTTQWLKIILLPPPLPLPLLPLCSHINQRADKILTALRRSSSWRDDKPPVSLTHTLDFSCSPQSFGD